MCRNLFFFIGILFLLSCNKVNLKKSCQGEWAFFINDTSYCELLINDSIVFPYHYGHRNGVAFSYKISNDTFFIYGNETETVEMSPIHYLGPDSFRILAITPHTLVRVKHGKDKSQSLALHYYNLDHKFRNKDIETLVAERVFVQINRSQRAFEPAFHERRLDAIYKKEKSGAAQKK